MGYEIDFLAVGKAGPGGDAIALRIGDLRSGNRDDQFVAVIDGGHASYGQKVVDHVREQYGTETVDVVVSTHLDQDHIAGLTAVVEQLEVRQLWMHEPPPEEEAAIYLAHEAARYEHKERLGVITASLRQSRGLATLARELSIEVIAPYPGLHAADGAFSVIGPTTEYYDSLVSRFRDPRPAESLIGMVGAALEHKTGEAVKETLEHETLEEGARTEAENSSSVVTLIQVDGRAVILTGDAGEDALNRAADHLDSVDFDWTSLRAIQIPHHGSRKNVTPSVLNRYLGEPVQRQHTRHAYVSCSPAGAPHHPAKRVTNAFHRRGCTVYATAGSSKLLHHDAPDRPGFSTAAEVPFYDEVD